MKLSVEIFGAHTLTGYLRNLNTWERVKMQRTESVGSVTSAFANVQICENHVDVQHNEETQQLRDLLQDKTERITELTETVDKLKHDAASWEFVRDKYFKRLGYTTPGDFQKQVDLGIALVTRGKS